MARLRVRIVVLLVVCLIVLGGALALVLAARANRDQMRRDSGAIVHVDFAKLMSGPRIVFRNTNLRDGYGKLAVVSLADPSGPRAISATGCDRLYATTSRVVCLSSTQGILSTHAARVLDDSLHVVQNLPLTGIPSRTRLTHDGRFVATTSFVAGDSYAGTSFSTRTLISRVGVAPRADLEGFSLWHGGHVIKPADRNFWGVTFAADDDTFFATVAWGGHTWLARGSISPQTLTTLHEDAECPSLSPDGTNVVFKQRGDLPPGKWRLADYNLATGRVTLLAETRSVDDQVEWLDDTHVLYGLARTGSEAAIYDVWSVPSDGTGQPALLIPEAWSPAIVR